MSDLNELHYDAFISYRHSELDSFVAEKLHKKLESFRLPRSVQSKLKDGRKGISRVFRDTEELPLSDNLSDSINTALKNSDYLITICSPRYLESMWCMREIETFLQMHDRSHVLVVLADGEPTQSFPEILTYEEIETTDENGERCSIRHPLEPLAADTRGANKKEILKAMDTAVTKLCAAIFGLNYDDLKQRHREAKLRRMMLVSGIISAAILIFAIVVTAMLVVIDSQKTLISDQYAQIQDKYAAQIADTGMRLLTDGRRKDAVYALRSVLPDTADEAYNAEALKNLYLAMEVYKVDPVYTPEAVFDAESDINNFHLSYDGKYLMVRDDYAISIYYAKSGELLRRFERSQESSWVELDGVFCGSEGVIVLEDGEVSYYSLGSFSVKDLGIQGENIQFMEAEDGSVTFVYVEDTLIGIDASGDRVYSIATDELFGVKDLWFYEASFDGNEAVLMLGNEDTYYYLYLEGQTGEVIATVTDMGSVIRWIILSDGVLYQCETGTDDEWNTVSKVWAWDMTRGTVLWETELEKVSLYSICKQADNLYVCSESEIIQLASDNGSEIEHYRLLGWISGTWTEEDSFYAMVRGGAVFCVQYQMLDDVTKEFYAYPPTEETTQVIRGADDLYVLFGDNDYIVRYENGITEDAEAIEYNDYYDPEDAGDILEDAEGINVSNISYSFYSSDEKYIVVNYLNNTTQILDAESLDVLKTFRADAGIWYMSYSKVWDGYIIQALMESWLVDEEFNIVCATDTIMGEKRGGFVISSQWYENYLVPFVDYEELIRRTDEYLDGYTPDTEIMELYNFQ